jgi:hypothetical protein
MSDSERDPPEVAEEQGLADYYLGVCLAALVVMVITVDRIRPGASVIIPAIPLAFGILALLARFTSGPPIILFTLCGLIFVQGGREPHFVTMSRSAAGGFLLRRFLLCAAALAFAIAFYRRLGVESGIFPPDRRKAPPSKPQGDPAPLPPVRRAARWVTGMEFVSIAVVVPLCSIAGLILWQVFTRIAPPDALGFEDNYASWRPMLLCGLIAGTGSLGGLIIGYLGRARATRTQNLLYLQDQLWRETRREQCRAHQWLVRSRFRARRKKERT